MRRRLLILAGALVLLALVGSIVFRTEIRRLRFSLALFSGEEMVEPFRSMPEFFPHNRVARGPEVSELNQGRRIELPETFEYQGETQSTAGFLAETDTTGLLILKNDAVVFEEWWRGNDETSRTVSWSVGKSFISALVGIAVGEGRIESIEEPITNYVPELEGSAYDGVRIKDILQMSSGARWNEDYSDPSSDINRMGRILAIGGSMDAFVPTLEREFEPGTFNRYNSADTQALGMLLVRATGKSVSDYLGQKIWRPLGMESDAYWLTDDEGMELAFGTLNAVMRDYARFGLLYLHGGRWKGKQIVPSGWVGDSLRADAPHLKPGANEHSDFPLGYGYQWWLMDGREGEFSAIGVYNQFIYVNPTRKLVIVKTSANSDYGRTDTEESFRELETIELFRAIGRSLR
jgi:CubicO group peptidase (beta-lactamase class C family)